MRIAEERDELLAELELLAQANEALEESSALAVEYSKMQEKLESAEAECELLRNAVSDMVAKDRIVN